MCKKRTPSVKRWLKGQILTRAPGMLTCKEFEDFMLAYLDEELPQKQRKRFEFHLRICRECREYVAAYQQTIAISQAVLSKPDDQMSADNVPADLIKAIIESNAHQ